MSPPKYLSRHLAGIGAEAMGKGDNESGSRS